MKKINLNKINQKAMRALYKALADIDNPRHIKEFLKDLLSSSETKDISRRFEAAKLLQKGKTYQDVQLSLSMGPLTINKIHFKTKGSKIIKKLL